MNEPTDYDDELRGGSDLDDGAVMLGTWIVAVACLLVGYCLGYLVATI